MSSAINAEPLYQFNTLNKKDGLASSVVYDLAQDRDGFMWFATEDGLQKFDGYELTTYRHSRIDPGSLSNNNVRSLLVDKSGTLWIGTEKGINVFQKDFENFKHYRANPTVPSGLASDQIRALYQSRDGKIWIGTTAGLSVLDKQSGQFKNYPQYKVRTIFEDETRRLWVGTLDGGLFLFDRMKETFKTVTIEATVDSNMNAESRDTKSVAATGVNKVSVVDIFQDSFGRIFVATWGSGVYLLDKDRRKLVGYDFDLPSSFVRSLFQDKKGRFWIGTSQGLVTLDPTQNRGSRIVAHDRNERSLLTNNIFKVFQSEDESIWVATYGGGVSRHYPASQRFESYGLHPIVNQGLNDASVYSLSEAEDGAVWIGSETGKLARFDPASKTFEYFDLIIDGKPNNLGVGVLFQLSSKRLLLGTANGLYLYHVTTGKTEYFDSKNNPFLATRNEATFVQRGPEGKIWIGIYGKGVAVFDLSPDGSLHEISQRRLSLENVQAISHLSKDSTLIATENSGIYLQENSGGSVDSAKLSLISGTENLSITDIGVDWKQRLWIATWSNGIKVKFGDNKLVSIDEANGLPNNSIYSIIPDESSNAIWASTNHGIVSIDASSMKIKHFSESDGLQGNEFNSVGILASSGHLYFGGVNGFNRFYPNIVERNISVRSPIVTELSIANQKVKVGQDSQNVLARSLLVNNRIDLTYLQTPFSLSFTSPQFVRPENIEFRYRLLGLSERWIVASKDLRRATYTNIAAGDYQFELQARAKGGSWQKKSATISVHISPPWWRTGLAKSGYVLVAILLLMSVILYAGRRRKHELRVQRAIQENEERLKLSLWASGYEFWDWNLKTEKISRSHQFKEFEIECDILSRNLQQLASYVHPLDLEMVREKLSNHIAGNSRYFDVSYRIVDAKRGWRWIQDRGKVVALDGEGAALRMSGTQMDITEIRQRDAQFEMLGQAFKSTSDGVWIRDHEWRLVECNPAYERITGFSLGEKKGEVMWFPEIQEQPENLLQRIRLSIEDKGNWQGEAWAERKNNDPFPQKLSIDTLHDEQGNICFYVGVFSDITFHKRTEEEFRKLANFDSLTGLPNRVCLYDRLNQTIEKTKRDKQRFALFLIDVDNFKRINDSLGHSVGDILIQQVADRLVNCNKEADTVARVGGDEFVIIMENINSAAQVANFAEVILKELNQPIFVRGQKLELNFSIGVTLAPDDAEVSERLMRNADTAMYEAKKTVENSYRFFSIEFNERARKRLLLENTLRKAIEDDKVELHYQPKVDLVSGQVCGVEALARWTHKVLGFVSPAEFIPLAEETGLIIPLGHQLMRKAVRQTREWVEDGIMCGRTAVNLSAHQFWNRNLVSEITRILEEEGLSPEYIELEVTESACMQDIEETREQMLALKKTGFSLALDDFGTGYSSLAQLKALPFDTLKIDKSFVDNIELAGADARVVKAIIDIAKTMEMQVVIEGVESKTQCEHLWANRAFVVQGFYFSRPLPPAELPDLLCKQWSRQDYLGNIAHNVTPLG